MIISQYFMISKTQQTTLTNRNIISIFCLKEPLPSHLSSAQLAIRIRGIIGSEKKMSDWERNGY